MSARTLAPRPLIPDGFAPPVSPRRILVLFEPGRSGEAALREAAERSTGGGSLTVVTVAPQADFGGCMRCRSGAFEYNCAVREEAHLELARARELLGSIADRSAFKALIERRDPPLARWAAERAFDLVLLPARRFAMRGHPAARALRRVRGTAVQIVR